MTECLIWLGCGLASAVLYRLGGAKGFNTKFRDLGIPIVMAGYMIYLGAHNILEHVIAFLLLFAFLTTYNKWVGRLLGLGSDDVFWPSWAITGLSYGVAGLPFAYMTGHLVGGGVRCIVLAILICVWCEKVNIDWLEEGGRGALIILTAPLLVML